MIKFLREKVPISVMYWSGLALMMLHFFWSDYLKESLPGYSVVRNVLMISIILCALALKPKLDKWALGLVVLLFVRFFFGDYLMEKNPWYILISYPLMAVITIVLTIKVLRAYLNESSEK